MPLLLLELGSSSGQLKHCLACAIREIPCIARARCIGLSITPHHATFHVQHEQVSALTNTNRT